MPKGRPRTAVLRVEVSGRASDGAFRFANKAKETERGKSK